MLNWRFNLILLCLFLFGAAIISRLVFLQILEHDFYSALAQGQQKIFGSWQGDRGEIYLQNYELPIATNKTYFFVYSSPKEIPQEKKLETAQVLSEILHLDQDSLLATLTQNSLYELVKDKLSEKDLVVLKEKKLAGVYFGQEKLRVYPSQNFASHILGFVNKEGDGQYGLEEYWDDVLRGKEKFIESERGPLGYLFSNQEEEAEIKGSDLILTVDYNIQYQAEKLLKNAQKQLSSVGGTIIVAEPHSGKILALANFPSFDPNQYFAESNFEIFQNEAIQKIFEPGSIFKPITMAAALDKEKITPATTYFDSGCLTVGGYKICNYQERIYSGELTMTNVLEKSINTGAVFAEKQVGHRDFLKYVEKFGFFEKTGIDTQGEVFSQNEELRKGYEINLTTASFGQGIEATPLQIIRGFSAIANGGKLVQPYLVEKIINNHEVLETRPEITDNNIISNQTALKLTTMLVSVVENGFGKAAKIPGYYVAGKTGTAQISWSALGINKKGYSDETWQSFIGFAPAFDPQFLILVKLNNPATKTAEYSALPIFRELAKYLIDYYQIPPDHNE